MVLILKGFATQLKTILSLATVRSIAGHMKRLSSAKGSYWTEEQDEVNNIFDIMRSDSDRLAT